MLVAACGGESTSEPEETAPQTTTSTVLPTTTTTVPPTTTPLPRTTTTTTAPPPATTEAPRAYEPTLVSYRYPSTGELEYVVSMEQHSEVTLEGGPSEQMPPGAIEAATSMEGTISYQTSPGPTAETTTIRILSDLQITDTKVSMGGIALPTPADADIPGLPGVDTPIDVTVVVDEQGNILEFSSEALDEVLDLFGEDSFLPTDSLGVQQYDEPFGPAFPDHPLEVGDTWAERIEEDGPLGMGTIVTTAEHRLVGVDNLAGATILVIESEYRTEALEWDMGEILQNMFSAFAGEETDEGISATQEALSDVTMLVSMSPTTGVEVTRFDLDAGVVLEGEAQYQGEVTTQMTLPDGSGEMSPLVSTAIYEVTYNYRLNHPSS